MGFYHRRHPERSDYYRLLESGFEAFARIWPEDFESRYVFLRKEVEGAVIAFLKYGISENGSWWRLCRSVPLHASLQTGRNGFGTSTNPIL